MADVCGESEKFASPLTSPPTTIMIEGNSHHVRYGIR